MKDLFAAIAVCWASVAHADEPAPSTPPDPPVAASEKKSLTKLDTSKIEALFTEGTKRYDIGEWDAAIKAFKQAYDLMPDPSFLFNIAQAYRQQGSCREATITYKSYLRNAPDEDRAKVEQFIKELEPCAKAEEENARRLLPPPPPPPQPPSWPGVVKWGGIATVGVGVALIGTAVGFSLRARGAQRDLIAECEDGCLGSEAEPFDRKGRSSDRAAKILYVVGGSVIAAGTAMVVYAVTRSERLAIRPTSEGAVVLLGGRF